MRTVDGEFCGLMGQIGFTDDLLSMSVDLSAVRRSGPSTSTDPQAAASPSSNMRSSSPCMCMGSGGDCPEEPDPCDDAVLRYINQVLMEEDLGGKTCMFQDSLALQAYEKSFSDALGERRPSPPPSTRACFEVDPVRVDGLVVRGELEWSRQTPSGVDSSFPSNTPQSDSCFSNSSSSCDSVDGRADSPVSTLPNPNSNSFARRHSLKCSSGLNEGGQKDRSRGSSKGSKGRKNHERGECYDLEENRSIKHSAFNSAEVELSQMFDMVLLCPDPTDEPPLSVTHKVAEDDSTSSEQLKVSKGKGRSRRGRRQGKKKKEEGKKKEMVDLMTLLTQCAQAVAANDYRTALERLKNIREHSSPSGDGSQRLAHCFADGLEARLAGRVSQLHASYASHVNRRTPASDILKAYHAYISSCPFKKVSNMFANRTIMNVAEKATKLHIIDFGILYGFQWPCLIWRLSTRPGGPPELRITGIDLPHPGFRPTERVEATGLRLANYCERFSVPFKYTAIAKKWETIQLGDIGIEEDEFLVVNCLYRFDNLLDDTVLVDNPRDAVLNLIKRISPNIFIHGIINGTYNAPFFLTRFREALFHFSALFDMFEACMPHEEEARTRFEMDIVGRDAINVIACEGWERVLRPETYKQWQVRNARAGLVQIPLKQNILNQVRTKVKSGYHKDFAVDEDGCWMLQGWKGRIVHALSCWKPA